MTDNSKHPCVFFDRDGIVNRPPGPGRYVEKVEDFHLLPEFIEALRVVKEKGYKAVVITNQRGVALGKMSLQTVQAIHDRMHEMLKTHRVALDGVYFCPHDHGQCTCRKPQPGMLIQAAGDLGLDMARSWMIGDDERDVEAGRRAGCHTVFVGGQGKAPDAEWQVAGMALLPAFLSGHL